MRALLLALGFLTRWPVPRVTVRRGDVAAAVRLYPLAGIAVGAAVAGAGTMGARVDPWLGATAALGAWVWVTGALHLDGLGDLADGLGAAHGDRDRLLTVMADPHLGSFGAVMLWLQLAAKLVALHLVLPAGWPVLVAIPAAARLGPLWWGRLLPALKPTGLGAAVAGAARTRDLVGWMLVLGAAAVAAPPLVATPVLVALLGVWFRQRLGGMTGDVHGAGIELTETGLLLIAAVVEGRA